MTNADFSALATCGDFDLTHNTAIASFSLQKLKTVSILRVSKNLHLKSLSFSALTDAERIFIFGSHTGEPPPGTCSFAFLTTTKELLLHRSNYTRLSAPILSTSGSFGVMRNTLLTQLGLSKIGRISGYLRWRPSDAMACISLQRAIPSPSEKNTLAVDH